MRDKVDYEHRLINVENDVQDKSTKAWAELCKYIEQLAASGGEEFAPFEYLGEELYAQIHTLPASIAKLKKVKKVWLYGSQLKRIPPEIGEMEALEYFDPYTSYHLHWFPYEITNCKNLKRSRVSTRALYGNYAYRRPFPDLTHNPVRYEGDTVKCSVCREEMEHTEQFWVSLRVGTDVLPLLVNVCSEACKMKLPEPPKNYIAFPHKGGDGLKQPPDWIEDLKEKTETKQSQPEESANHSAKKTDLKDMPILRLIRKIWE